MSFVTFQRGPKQLLKTVTCGHSCTDAPVSPRVWTRSDAVEPSGAYPPRAHISIPLAFGAASSDMRFASAPAAGRLAGELHAAAPPIHRPCASKASRPRVAAKQRDAFMSLLLLRTPTRHCNRSPGVFAGAPKASTRRSSSPRRVTSLSTACGALSANSVVLLELPSWPASGPKSRQGPQVVHWLQA